MSREQIQARALVLRAVDFGERDCILTLLIEGLGKRSAMAKGGRASKRRFAGTLESFRISRFTLTDRGSDKMAWLVEARVEEDFPGIEASFEKISAAAYATELVRELLREGEGGEMIFAALAAHYRQSDGAEDERARLEADLTTLTLRALALAGFAPSLERCFRCQAPVTEAPGWRLMAEGQGAVCAGCLEQGERSFETDRGELVVMDRLYGGYAEDLPSIEVLRKMRPKLQSMVSSAVGKELRSQEFLKMVLG